MIPPLVEVRYRMPNWHGCLGAHTISGYECNVEILLDFLGSLEHLAHFIIVSLGSFADFFRGNSIGCRSGKVFFVSGIGFECYNYFRGEVRF